MRLLLYKYSAMIGILAVAAICVQSAAAAPGEKDVPPPTAIPLRFERSVDAEKARPGDPVIAKTLQVIPLPNGVTLPRGSILTGRVVEARAFQFDSAPYARQTPSILSIHFDRIQNGDLALNVNLSLRAIADPILSREAATPHYIEEVDARGTMQLIGGDEFDPFNEPILAADGSIIAYNRKHGVFAHLIAAKNSQLDPSISCLGTDSEQSVAIFSPRACGVYGFSGIYLSSTGQDGSGAFILASTHHSVKLYAGSTALLQVVK